MKLSDIKRMQPALSCSLQSTLPHVGSSEVRQNRDEPLTEANKEELGDGGNDGSLADVPAALGKESYY